MSIPGTQAQPRVAPQIAIDIDRLMGRIMALGEIGALPGGGCKRLALSDEDRAGRALVCSWFEAAGLRIQRDLIGNTWAIRPDGAGRFDAAPVVIGSHIDTVATGGLYDGVLGVLGGLEVIESLNDAGIATARPVAVAFFTNEEGARFQPDMMGSGVAQGQLDAQEMLAVRGIDGMSVAEALERIDAAGDAGVGALAPAAYLELHIEQGPVLEQDALDIGVVSAVQGISWSEFTIEGEARHAGTTPMAQRRDAAVVAAGITLEARAIARDFGAAQVATVGRMTLSPDLVNVVPERAVMTVDLRNTDATLLEAAQQRLMERADSLARAEGCNLAWRSLARFAPTPFDPGLMETIEQAATRRGLSHRRMASGAGHDAQMFAPNCPAAMIFVPSQDGISHNIREYTAPPAIAAGVGLLADVVLAEAGRSAAPIEQERTKTR